MDRLQSEKKQKRLEQHYVALKEVRHKARTRQAHHSERGAHHKALIYFLIHWVILPATLILAILGASEGTTTNYDLPHYDPTTPAMTWDNNSASRPERSIVEDDADVARRKMMKAGNNFAYGVSKTSIRDAERQAAAVPRNNPAEQASIGPPDPPDVQWDALAQLDAATVADPVVKRGFLRRLFRK